MEKMKLQKLQYKKVIYKQSARKRWISYLKNCKGQLVHAQYYEVIYALGKNGKIYIKEVYVKTPKRNTRIEYTESEEILNINLTNQKEKT